MRTCADAARLGQDWPMPPPFAGAHHRRSGQPGRALEGPASARARLPLEHRADDRLGRTEFAENLASRIYHAPFHRVIGLEGPEGAGKTTVVNMTVEALLEIDPDWEVLRVDPVTFSGSRQDLTSFFFAELSAQLGEVGKDHLKRLAMHLVEYGQLLGAFGVIPVVGTAFTAGAAVSRTTAGLVQGQPAPPCSNTQRSKLNSMIEEHGGRFLVVVDNVDRLTAEETAEVLRFVRVVANFPSTTYLLVYDRERLAEVLGDAGEDVLDQLVPVTYHLPPVLESPMSGLVSAAIEAANRQASTTATSIPPPGRSSSRPAFDH